MRYYLVLSIADIDTFHKQTSIIRENNDVMVIWLDFEDGVDSFEKEQANCGTSSDSRCISYASINGELTGDTVQLTGNFTLEEAQTLADLINSGSLPTKLEEISSRTINASFGEDALAKTFVAGIVGIVAIMLLLIAVYRFSGVIASIGILIYTMLVFLIFNLIGGRLTLPGIAAVVIGIGMSVDACVISFAQIKEELRNKVSLEDAFKKGNKNSISSIMDANVTTLIAAVILFILGESSVKGFATMLIISIVATIFVMVLILRWILEMFIRSGFFNNRLSGTFDYFWRTNDGMLINITYPQVYGGTAPSTNSGTYKTHGWELTLNWQDRVSNDFSYNIGFSLSDARTKVSSYEGKTAITWGVNSIVEGQPLNSLYVFKTDGMFQNQAEVDAYYAEMNGNVSGSLMGNVKNGTVNELTPGCVRRVDLNGDNDITTDDLYYYGDTDPHFNFGLNLGMNYKNFDLSVFFQGVGQQYNVRNGQMGCAFWSGWTNTNGYFMDNTWYAGDDQGYHAANLDAKFPLISRNGNRNNWNYKNYNDINVINTWYARCKQVQIGYSLPKSLLNKVGLQRVRVWLAGENLFDISNVKDGYDPEASAKMATYSGVDVFASSVSFGVDVTF